MSIWEDDDSMKYLCSPLLSNYTSKNLFKDKTIVFVSQSLIMDKKQSRDVGKTNWKRSIRC